MNIIRLTKIRRQLLLIGVFIVLVLALGFNQQILDPVVAQDKTRQSDLMTSELNSTYYMTVGGSGGTFRNMSTNYYMVSVDILTVNPNIISWYNVGFYTRLMNGDQNWTLFDESPMNGIASRQSRFYDYVFSVDVNETFPSWFRLSVGVRFIENVVGGKDVYGSAYWTSVVNITVSDTAQVVPIIPRLGYNETSTVTESVTTTANVTETVTDEINIVAPFVSVTPADSYYDIDTPYNVTWQLLGSVPRNYRVNVTDGVETYTLIQGKWSSGQIITVDSITQTEMENIYTYTLEADNDFDMRYLDEVSITVVNISYWLEQYPELGTDVAARLPQILPVSFTPIIIAMIVLSIVYSKRK